MGCQSCEVLCINGVNCHEHGCPDKWKDEERECMECGQKFKPERFEQMECKDCQQKA